MINPIHFSDLSEIKQNVLRATLLLTIASIALGILIMTKRFPITNFIQGSLLFGVPPLIFITFILAHKYSRSPLSLEDPILTVPVEAPKKPLRIEELDFSQMTYEKFKKGELNAQLKELGLEFTPSTIWLTTTPIQPFAKLHISIHREDMANAFKCLFPLFLRRGLKFFKICIYPERMGFNSVGKEFVIYIDGTDVQKGIELIKEYASENNLCDAIVAELEKEGVRSGEPSMGDLPLKRGKNFIYFRFDVPHLSRKYIQAPDYLWADFTRRESAMLTDEPLFGNDFFATTIKEHQIEKYDVCTVWPHEPEVFEALKEQRDKIWIFVVMQNWRKYMPVLFLKKNRDDPLYFYKALLGEPDGENNFEEYINAVRPKDLAFGDDPYDITRIVYFFAAVEIIGKICQVINPKIEDWQNHQFGIPFSTFYYEFFLPFKRLKLSHEKMPNVFRPFEAHPDLEKRVTFALAKCAFRKVGAQPTSLDPVYIHDEQALDKMIEEHYVPLKQ